MVNFELLANIVEEVSGTPKEDLISKRKFRALVELRMICSNILKENHKLGVEKIGSLLNINHATVTYHMKTHQALLVQKDGKYKEMYETISAKYKIALFTNHAGEDVKKQLLQKKYQLEKMLFEVNELLELI